MRSLPRIAAVAFAVMSATAFAQEAPQEAPAPVLAEEIEELRATVTDVDKERRLVSLRSEDGREITLEAGDEVRNFDQVDVGDTVVARFYESLAVEVTDAPPGAAPAVVATARAPVGERPAAGVVVVDTAVVAIESVDVAENVVRFTDPDGRPREVEVRRPEMQEFIAKLNPGDRVLMTYGGGLAIELEPQDEAQN